MWHELLCAKSEPVETLFQVRGGQRVREGLGLGLGERGEHRGARGVPRQPALRQLQTHRQGQVRLRRTRTAAVGR